MSSAIYSHVISVDDLKVFRSMMSHVISRQVAHCAMAIQKAQTDEEEAEAIENAADRTTFYWAVHSEIEDLILSNTEQNSTVTIAKTDKEVHDFFFAVAYDPHCDAGAPRMQEAGQNNQEALKLYGQTVQRLRHAVDSASISAPTASFDFVQDLDSDLFPIPNPGLAM